MSSPSPDGLLSDLRAAANSCARSMVWQTLVILVHRPFVAQGHLSSNGDVSEASWQKCLEAADRTSDILKIYKKMLGLTRAPFLISYCAYIAATIHVRVLAQAGSNSLAKHNLRFCMEVFAETETINTGVSKAKEGEETPRVSTICMSGSG